MANAERSAMEMDKYNTIQHKSNSEQSVLNWIVISNFALCIA